MKNLIVSCFILMTIYPSHNFKKRGINVARLKYCIDLYKKWREVAFRKKDERRTYNHGIKLKEK